MLRVQTIYSFEYKTGLPCKQSLCPFFTAFLISLFSLRPWRNDQRRCEFPVAQAAAQVGYMLAPLSIISHTCTHVRTLRLFQHSISAKIGGNLKIYHTVTSIGKTQTVKIAPCQTERKWKKGLSIQRLPWGALHLWQTTRLYAHEPSNDVRGDWPQRDENDWMSMLGKYARFETGGAKVTLRWSLTKIGFFMSLKSYYICCRGRSEWVSPLWRPTLHNNNQIWNLAHSDSCRAVFENIFLKYSPWPEDSRVSKSEKKQRDGKKQDH